MFELLAFLGFVGLPELAIILVIMLVLFGNRLPSIMRSLGQSITEFKKGIREEANGGDKGETVITHERD